MRPTVKTATISKLPDTATAMGLAVASGLSVAMAMSGGNGVAGGVLFFGALAFVALSTRYTARAYSKLSEREFHPADLHRWVMLSIALVANGIVCLMLAGYAVIVIGIFVTGRGMVG